MSESLTSPVYTASNVTVANPPNNDPSTLAPVQQAVFANAATQASTIAGKDAAYLPPPHVAVGILKNESNFNVNPDGSTGHINGGNNGGGIGQLSPAALQDVNQAYGRNFTVDQMKDPTTSATASMLYYALQKKRFGSDPAAALAYRAGGGATHEFLMSGGQINNLPPDALHYTFKATGMPLAVHNETGQSVDYAPAPEAPQAPQAAAPQAPGVAPQAPAQAPDSSFMPSGGLVNAAFGGQPNGVVSDQDRKNAFYASLGPAGAQLLGASMRGVSPNERAQIISQINPGATYNDYLKNVISQRLAPSQLNLTNAQVGQSLAQTGLAQAQTQHVGDQIPLVKAQVDLAKAQAVQHEAEAAKIGALLGTIPGSGYPQTGTTNGTTANTTTGTTGANIPNPPGTPAARAPVQQQGSGSTPTPATPAASSTVAPTAQKTQADVNFEQQQARYQQQKMLGANPANVSMPATPYQVAKAGAGPGAWQIDLDGNMKRPAGWSAEQDPATMRLAAGQKKLDSYNEDQEKAVNDAQDLGTLQQLVSNGLKTGRIQEATLQMRGLANSLGLLSPADANNLAGQQLVDKLTKVLATGVKPSDFGRTTQAEYKQFQGTLPNIGDSKQAFDLTLALAQNANQRRQVRAADAAAYLKANNNLDGFDSIENENLDKQMPLFVKPPANDQTETLKTIASARPGTILSVGGLQNPYRVITPEMQAAAKQRLGMQ